MGPKFGETSYISDVNKARNVKSDGPVAVNKNSDHGSWGGQCPQLIFSKLLELFETRSSYSGCRLIYTKSPVTDITLPRRRYIGAPFPHHKSRYPLFSLKSFEEVGSNTA